MCCPYLPNVGSHRCLQFFLMQMPISCYLGCLQFFLMRMPVFCYYGCLQFLPMQKEVILLTQFIGPSWLAVPLATRRVAGLSFQLLLFWGSEVHFAASFHS